MEDACKNTQSMLKTLASTLSRIDKRLERQADILQAIRASRDQSRRYLEWPKIDTSEDLILLEGHLPSSPNLDGRLTLRTSR